MNWQERAEKAEAELARLRAAPNEIGLGKGEFVIWPVKINGVHGLAFVKTDDPKVVGTSHAEPEDGQIELGAGDSAIYFGNAESAMVLAERLQYVISLMTGSDAAPVPAVAAPAVPEEWRKVMVELADDLAIEIDQNYPPERRVYPSEQRRYEGEMEIVNRAHALLQPAPQAPTVPDGRVSQDESTLTMAASALALFRAGESAEYMAKAIEALLQSAPQSGSEPVAHHPV
jgi:hypothetical protein